MPSDPLQSSHDSWLSLVDHLNIKAFVNLTLADSVRRGVQNLLFVTGFGSMRPNTLVLGFYDACAPQDHLGGRRITCAGRDAVSLSPVLAQDQRPQDQRPPPFPAVRGAGEAKDLQQDEYVSLIADALKMGKNIILARYFHQFSREEVLGAGWKVGGHRGVTAPFIDLWPLNLLRPDPRGYVDVCSLFLLQLAGVLCETRSWSQARLRLFLCVEAGCRLEAEEEAQLRGMLKELRISAQVHIVAWDQVVTLHWQRQGGAGRGGARDEGGAEGGASPCPGHAHQLTEEYICAVNALIRTHGAPRPAVRFLYLPRPPADTSRYHDYLHHMDLLSRDLGPTLLVQGITPVVTTYF